MRFLKQGAVFFVLIALLCISLIGCSGSIVQRALDRWESAEHKRITETFSIQSCEIIIPSVISVKAGIIGEIKLVRETTASGVVFDMLAEKFVLDAGGVDGILSGIIGEDIVISALPDVKYNINIRIENGTVYVKQTLTNFNRLLPDGGYGREEVIESEPFKLDVAAGNGVLIDVISDTLIFGAIPTDGELDSDTGMYSYQIAEGKVNNSLLKLLKVAVDANANADVVNNQTLHELLKSIFGTADVIKIADGILTPDAVNVKAKLTGDGENAYFGVLQGNSVSTGRISQSVMEKLLTAFDKSDLAGYIKDDVRVNFNILIKSVAEIL